MFYDPITNIYIKLLYNIVKDLLLEILVFMCAKNASIVLLKAGKALISNKFDLL